MLKKILIAVGAIIIVGVGVIVAMIGPKDIMGMIQYDQRKKGDLKVGDRAPNTTPVALDGKTKQPLLAGMGSKPTILVFGSFT